MPPDENPASSPDPISAELVRLQWAADCRFSEDLAMFQASVVPAPALDLATVVSHARPAFELGFSYLVRQDPGGVEVILRHKGGAEASSVADAATPCSPALLLAGLLGIPVASPSQGSNPDQQTKGPISVQPEHYSECASEPEAEPVAVATAELAAEPEAVAEPDLIGPDSPIDRPSDHPSLTPLTQEQIDSALSMIRVMSPAQRKQFSIAFRNAFSIDASVIKIADKITQLQHLEFIDRFSIESAGGIAP